MKKELTYRTFSDLLNEVQLDLPVMTQEGMVDPAQLIKIAKKINYDLGLRIHSTKHTILEVCNGKAKLPDDFYVLNHALICSSYIVQQPIITGRQTEDTLVACLKCHKSCISIDDPCYVPDECCRCNHVYTNECGDSYEVVEKRGGYQTHIYREFEQLTFKRGKFVDNNCYNVHVQSRYNAEIKDGFLRTNLNSGKIYLSYEGSLEDDEGNLLVLDHEMINEYYEFAIKERVLQNLYLNGEDVERKWGMIKQELKVARNNALGIVNMPDFSELQSVWEMNRKAQYNKYYSMFYS